MDRFENIINHPNFGRLYSQSRGIQTAFKTFLSDPSFQDIFPTLKISSVGEDVSFSILDDARKIIKQAGESNSDYFNRVADQARQGFTRNRAYTSRPFESTITGGFVNSRLRLLSEMSGADFSVGSFPMRNPEASTQLRSIFKGKGLIVPDTETTTAIMASIGNKNLGMQETFDLLGINPGRNLNFKRLKSFFNETPLEAAYKAEEKLIGVAGIENKAFINSNPYLVSQVENVIERAKRQARQNGSPLTAEQIQDITEKAYEKPVDGSLLISRSAYNRQIDFRQQEINKMKNDLKNSNISENSDRYREIKLQIRKQQRKIDQLRRAESGSSVSARVFNGFDFETYERFDFAKGEALLVEDEDFYNAYKKGKNLLSREEAIAKVDYITASSNLENKFGINKASLVDQISFATSDPLPGVKTSLSNTLTTGTYGRFIDSDGYLLRGLKSSLEEDMTAIKEGKIPPGIDRLIKDLENKKMADLSPGERLRYQEAQAFARRLKSLKDSGGDLSKDPFLTRQLVQQVRESHFGKAKRGMNYEIDGQEVRGLSGRFPMQGSTLAHLQPTAITNLDPSDNRAGVLRIDHKGGRFGISAIDSIQTNAAFGGFDFDDSLYTFYQYDTKTRRLLVKALRDPNAMGEYMVFDADITHDANIPSEIRAKYAKHKKLIDDISLAKKGGIEESALVNKISELNTLKSDLDNYFRGESFIQKIDLVKEYSGEMVAPTGYSIDERSKRRYARKSSTLSMEELDATNPFNVARRIATENEMLRRGSGDMSIFRFQGLDYSEDIEKYFNKIDHPLPKKTGKLVYEDVQEAIEQAQRNNSTLGRAINQYTNIDSFRRTHLDMTGEGNVPPEIVAKLKELLNDPNLRMDRIGRETLIDSLMKETNPTINEAALRGISSNSERLGKIMRELQDFATAENIDFRVGLDSVIYQERIRTDSEQVEALIRGYGSKDFLLPSDDPKSYMTQLQKQMHKALEEFDEAEQALSKEVREALSDAIGDDFTPQQRSRAQEIIEDFEKIKTFAKSVDVQEELSKAVESGDTRLLDSISKRGMQIRTLANLEGMSASDLNAVTRVLLDSSSELSLINQATSIDDLADFTVSDLFRAAAFQDETFSDIDSIADEPKKLHKYIRMLRDENSNLRYNFTSRGQAVIDTATRNERLVQAAEALKEQFLLPGFQSHHSLGNIIEEISSAPTSTTVTIPHQLGEVNKALREASDIQAENLVEGLSFNGMRRFNLRELLNSQDLAVSKATRTGLVALIAFAGLGVGHRLVKGDRTIEQFDPFPLVEKGSEYEKIIQDNPPVINSFQTTSGATNYRISLQGYDEIDQLQTSLQSVLPQKNATIYNSTSSPYSASSGSNQILRERTG